jgi:cell division septum initiation protein DivIVA
MKIKKLEAEVEKLKAERKELRQQIEQGKQAVKLAEQVLAALPKTSGGAPRKPVQNQFRTASGDRRNKNDPYDDLV